MEEAAVVAPVRVFVYGTLLAGERNHHRLADAACLGAARTEAAFDLVDLGTHPALVAGGGTSVSGEVYEVDARTLRALDRLEDHPRSYRRLPIRLEDGREVLAYLQTREQALGLPRIAGGDWRQARSGAGVSPVDESCRGGAES